MTTDFGTADAYVAAVKGVILNTNPDAAIVDVSHDVPPHDINHAAHVLGSAHGYFPNNTVHICVVDPGVGTERSGLAFLTPCGVFVGPDNGVFTYVVLANLERHVAAKNFGRQAGKFMEPIQVDLPASCYAYALSDQQYWRKRVSPTFHGRDIFAPVAAHLSLSLRPSELGSPVKKLICLNVHPPVVRRNSVKGRAIFVDHFGTLITNIQQSHLRGEVVRVDVGDATIGGRLSTTFANRNGLIALIGSRGYLEIAENLGSAARRLKVGVGTEVEVRLNG